MRYSRSPDPGRKQSTVLHQHDVQLGLNTRKNSKRLVAQLTVRGAEGVIGASSHAVDGVDGVAFLDENGRFRVKKTVVGGVEISDAVLLVVRRKWRSTAGEGDCFLEDLVSGFYWKAHEGADRMLQVIHDGESSRRDGNRRYRL